MSKDTSKLEEILEVCPKCGGYGFTAEHDLNDPHENGCSNCPVQVQCEQCHAKGYFVEKADLLAWHREECLRIIGDPEKPDRPDGSSSHKVTVRNLLRKNQRRKLRASLEVEDVL